MKMFKKIFMLASCATMLMAGSAVANAHCCEYNNVCDTKAYQTQAVQDVLFTSGKIVEVNENMIVVKGEHNIIAAMITDDTYLLNGKNGKAKKLSSFKVGKEVTVYHSPKMTRSIPAQSAAYAVVLGDSSEKMGKFFKVEEVTMSEDKTYVSVINTNESLIATVDKKANKNFAEIKAGDNLMVWYDMMTMSLPARTNANKVVIL
ncbi:MAG: hypothetical protein II203_04555 [Phascolarctobacterium sp.]|nr:hypothetical protein [Phascolarctobacterium sp.]